MLRALKRRPSPAMAVALVALFLSLTGASYGVATGFIDSREILDNQVRSRDLRNNDVRTQDLRNNEVRGVDIRNSTIQGRDVALNTLGSEDIAESKLRKVPEATKADSAGSALTAATAGTAGNAATVSTVKTIPLTTVAEGAAVTLATHGPLTLTARCDPDLGDVADTRGRVAFSSTEPNSTSTDEPDLDPGESAPAVASLDQPGGEPDAVDAEVSAFAPSGTALSGVLSAWSDASAGASGTCRFHGHLVLNG
ncbi:MAG TPA: hypothetical protein VEQ61_05780 [Thermoleophilaceae bacterium]|nr:hypothetical protein [Thermoleophilaceae bacterium]